MFLTDAGLIYKGIRPLQKLGALALVNPLAGLTRSVHIPDSLKVVPPDPWSGDAQRGRDMIAGTFRFAGQTIERENLSWAPEKACPEWISALHGFEWLRDLRSVGGDRARRMAREMVVNWVARYQKICPSVWRAEVTGVRIASWITFHDFFCASADDAFRQEYFASLVHQARHLHKALPGNLSGIPLLRALKGLAYAGLALEGNEEWMEYAFKNIFIQVREQILPDGGHVSRSPQATFECFQVLVDLRTTLSAARVEMPEELQHAIDRIAPALKFFRHGDGTLCQFNGGQEGNPNIVDATLMHSGARGRAMKTMPHSGYEKICQGRASLIMDIGMPVPSQYSGRAHAGVLGIEYSFGKDRVFVNCGTSDVQGRWRDILRATAAHSVMVVDGRNVCQFDAQGLPTGHPEVRAKRHEDAQVAMIEGGHAGYMPRFGLKYRRCVRLQDDGDILVGEEQLIGRSGIHFAVRFHLHPWIQASLIQEGEEILLRARSGTGWRFKAEGAVPSIEESVYAAEGETPRRSLQIVLNGTTGNSRTTVSWVLKREKI
jgi:uncharacterized heparinase superfamily protein